MQRLLHSLLFLCCSVAFAQRPAPTIQENAGQHGNRFFVEYKVSGHAKTDTVSRVSKRFRDMLLNGEIERADLPGTDLCLRKSRVSGLALHTKPGRSYKAGDVIAYAFVKKYDTGYFSSDYEETQFGAFVNDAQTPNARCEKVADGILLIATAPIPPNTEIACSYRQFLALFPGDPTVGLFIVPKY
ncbi:MAG: hypothetical protein KF690_05250 [Bacteroidetes bacterium]|nr:hypothetical protein [Bacteroidota bacterium]